MSAWKQFERDAAALFHGKRFWANSGESVDFEGEVQTCARPCSSCSPVRVHGQCKLVKRLSLEQLTQLAEKNDVVCVKVRRGSGVASPALVVLTFENWRRLVG